MNIHSRLTPIAVAVLLAACGGSSSDPAPSAATASGKVVDGYIVGATVTCDANSNGVADSGEAATTTNATGNYTLPCDGGLIATGGTDADTGEAFQGKLRAPAGAQVVTPLTTLVSLGLTPAKVAEVLGLPVGTDVTKLDPAQQTGGVYVNQTVYQKTLAVQHLIQQTAELIFSGAAGGSASTAVGRAQYDAIAQVVATRLNSVTSASPLVSSSGVVSSTLVSTLVTAAVDAIKTSTDPALASLKTSAASVDGTRVAAFATTALTNQLNNLATATGAGLSAASKIAQTDTVINTVSDGLRVAGAYSASSSINIASAAGLTASSVSVGQISATAAATLANLGISVAATTVNNYFAITSNTITLGHTTPHAYTLTQLNDGITLTGPSSTTDDLFNISFNLTATGTPITGTVSTGLGFELLGKGDDKRIFRFIIDKVNLTLSGSTVSASVPADAILTVYARKPDGVSEVTVSLTNLGANTLSTSEGAVTFNAGAVVTHILTQANSQTSSFFTHLIDSTGTFALTGVLSNTVPIRTEEKNQLPVASVTIGGKSVGGPAVVGTVTVN